MQDETIWGIHGGETGDADALFLKEKAIAIGWARIGDLSKIEPNREAFKAAVAAAFPDKKLGAIPVFAGQLYRFVHEMKEGDLVVYPSKRDRKVHIGRIKGPYFHNAGKEPRYPNRRQVEWLKAVQRTRFSQGTLYEIGSAMTLFTVRNYADEVRAVLEGAQVALPPGTDDTVTVVAEEIQQNTRDFIVKALSQELKGHKFAAFVAHMLNLMGYRTRLSPEGPDRGVDIVAHRDELGFEPPIIKVQVKSTEGSVGDPVVSALYGKVDANEYGLLVTLGTYTKQAKSFAENKTNLRLIDGEEFVGLILTHYERLDSTYKGVVPLKQVFVPQLVKEAEE